MDGNLLSTMSAGAALQVFMAGFIFRECCDIKAVLENIGPILIVVSLTISNAILVKNFMMVRGGGQKIVTHPHLARSDFQVSNNSRLIQQREVPVKPNDSFLIVSDVPSYEFPSSLIDLSGTYKLESKSNYEGEKRPLYVGYTYYFVRDSLYLSVHLSSVLTNIRISC